MPASSPSPIHAALDQVAGLTVPDLPDVPAQVIDPRPRHGVRHRLVVVLTAAVCAVAAGAQTYCCPRRTNALVNAVQVLILAG